MVPCCQGVVEELRIADDIVAIWSQEAWKTPACVFTPSDSQTLAAGLRIMVSRDIKFAVRSGGHMPVAGHNSIDR